MLVVITKIKKLQIFSLQHHSSYSTDIQTPKLFSLAAQYNSTTISNAP